MALRMPVIQKPALHPHAETANATIGSPITLENLAEASKTVVARARSLTGNQYPVALDEPGNAGASPIPGKMRESRISPNPLTMAVKKLAIDQIILPTRIIHLTPSLSSIAPTGICKRV